ncbi:hypothetical protein GIB67_041724 [Kingdonia uniflora]|uniref:Uncharacterized protein n=1 Tax=Kingdonia uniflora TaxID=39325 RepID=A0A7J7MQV5_9MAGN|nr:hypothetical protein GIB67_041724 [Kingdonia uniflora]
MVIYNCICGYGVTLISQSFDNPNRKTPKDCGLWCWVDEYLPCPCRNGLRTFDWPKEVWENIIAVNSKARKYMTAPLQHRDLLEKLLEGLFVTGDFAWSSGICGVNVVDEGVVVVLVMNRRCARSKGEDFKRQVPLSLAVPKGKKGAGRSKGVKEEEVKKKIVEKHRTLLHEEDDQVGDFQINDFQLSLIEVEKKRSKTIWVTILIEMSRISMVDHYNRFTEMIANLLEQEEETKDEYQAFILLKSYPISYEHLKKTIIYGKEALYFGQVSSILFSNEERRNATGETNQAKGLLLRERESRGGFEGIKGDRLEGTSLSVQHLSLYLLLCLLINMAENVPVQEDQAVVKARRIQEALLGLQRRFEIEEDIDAEMPDLFEAEPGEPLYDMPFAYWWGIVQMMGPSPDHRLSPLKGFAEDIVDQEDADAAAIIEEE